MTNTISVAIDDIWDQTTINNRERILLGVLTGPEKKVTAFALATKTFTQLPDYIRYALCNFAGKGQPDGSVTVSSASH